jgi:outer membrane protein TolC
MSLSYIHPWYGIKLIGLSTVLAWGILVPDLLAQTSETTGSPPEEQSAPISKTIPACASSEASETPPSDRSTALNLAPNPDSLFLPSTPPEVQIARQCAISLADAIAIARENNKTAQIQALQVTRQEAVLRQQQALLWPTLTLNSSLQNTGTDTNLDTSRDELLRGSSGDSTQYTTSLDGAVRVDYAIVDFTRNPNIRAAEKLVRQAELQLEQTLEELDRDVAIDYYNLQQADEQVRIFEQSVRAAERSLQDAQALEKAGVGTRFAVLQSEVQLSNERQNLVNAISDQLQARRQLAQRLNLAQTAEIVAGDPIAQAGTWDLSLDESIILAYQNRPELERRLVEREANEYQRKAQLGAIKPSVSFFGQYNLNQAFTNVSREQFNGDSESNQDSLTNQYQVGVNLRWRFFDGGAAKAAARQEEVDIQVSELQFEDDRNQIRQQVEVAFYEVEANAKNIDTSTRGVEQAQEALRLARLRFQAGVGTQIDVINAERDLTQSEGNLANAILGYNQALARLKQAVSQ